MNNEFLQYALRYAERGLAVFPCMPGQKRPATESGFKDAVLDPQQISEWWQDSPRASIGLATGEVSRLFVLDIDPDKDGQQSLQWYLDSHGPLPETVTSQTGSGGHHYLFKYPGYEVPSSSSRIAPGIDIRGDGGYAVLPPSRHPGGGTYRWLKSFEDVEIADSPQWLLDKIRELGVQSVQCGQNEQHTASASAQNVHSGQNAHDDQIIKRAIAYIESSPGAISKKDGHKMTFWLAMVLLHGFMLDPEDALQILAKHHNPLCEPPWSDKELQHKIDSAAETTPNKPRGWLLDNDMTIKHPEVDISGIVEQITVTKPQTRRPEITAETNWCPFPTDLFPGPVRQFIREGATAMIVDEVYFGLPALVTASAAIGNRLRVQLKPHWEETAILWGAILGRSGTTKTPPLQAVVDPLQLVDNTEQERYQAELVAEAIDPQEALRYLTNDITIEGLVQQLSQSAHGILIFVDELAGWVKSFAQYKRAGNDMENWLSLYSANTLKIDRKSGPTIYIPRASCSILGGIQPGVFRRTLRDEHYDAGLVARILLSKPPVKQKTWTDDYLTDQSVESWDRIVRRLLELRTLDGENSFQLPVVRLSPEALELYKVFFNRRGEELMSIDHEALRSAYSKLEGGAARLALIIHCLRWAAGELDNESLLVMDQQSMIAGIRLSDWFLEESRRIYTELDGDANMQLADWVEERGGKISASALHKKQRGKFPSKQDAEKALQQLVDEGYGNWLKTQNPNGGPRMKEVCSCRRMTTGLVIGLWGYGPT